MTGVDKGYLIELNRRLLHPLGLALGIAKNDELCKIASCTIVDNRANPAGMVFGEFTPDDIKKAMIFDLEYQKRMVDRGKALGFFVEPLDRHRLFVGNEDCRTAYLKDETKKEIEAIITDLLADNKACTESDNPFDYAKYLDKITELKSSTFHTEKIKSLAYFLFSKFWSGFKTNPTDSSIRNIEKDEYYEMNKRDWEVDAECLLTIIEKGEL